MRAKCYYMQMLGCIKQLLFEGLCFENDIEKNEEIKDKIFGKLFADAKDEYDKVYSNLPDDRGYYSMSLQTAVINILKEELMKADAKIVNNVDLYFCTKQSQSFSEYQQKRSQATEMADVIHSNLFEIFSQNKLKKISDTLLRIYREAYSDIGCLLILDISPNFYNNTFLKSIPFEIKDEYYDMEREIRNFVVADAVCDCKHVSDLKEWKKYKEGLKARIMRENDAETDRQINASCDKIKISQDMLDIFCVYMRKCAERFCTRIDTIEELSEFRKHIKVVMNNPHQEVLKNILRNSYFKNSELEEVNIENNN